MIGVGRINHIADINFIIWYYRYICTHKITPTIWNRFWYLEVIIMYATSLYFSVIKFPFHCSDYFFKLILYNIIILKNIPESLFSSTFLQNMCDITHVVHCFSFNYCYLLYLSYNINTVLCSHYYSHVKKTSYLSNTNSTNIMLSVRFFFFYKSLSLWILVYGWRGVKTHSYGQNNENRCLHSRFVQNMT